MTRRRVVACALALAALALPATADAQAEKTRRIGFLGAATSAGYAPQLWALRQGLRDLGWIEGKNLAIEYRWAEDRYERLPDLADELVRLKVDLIVTHGTPGSLAAKQATKTIPVVMAVTGDPVAAGLMAYAVNFPEVRRRSAVFVDKILRGREAGRPADRAGGAARADRQPQDREGARPDAPAIAHAAGGPLHPVERRMSCARTRLRTRA